MPLGLARDSMLDLAEMAELAKKMDDGEFKTCIEISEGGTSSDSLVDISPQKEGYQKQQQQQPQYANNNGSCGSTSNETPSMEQEGGGGETKTPEEHEMDDAAVNDEDERSSIANSSIDSDMALHHHSTTTSTASATPATPNTPSSSSFNGSSGGDSTTSSKQKKSPTNYGRYSGFHAADYYDDDYYSQDYTAYSNTGKKNQQVPNLLGKNKNNAQPMWCCLFPWNKKLAAAADKEEEEPTTLQEQQQAQEQNQETLVDVNTTPPTSTVTRSSSKEEDDRSIGSDAFGERLSDKDRQAVLARLRLAQPEDVGDASENNADSPSSPDPVNGKKGLLNGISLPPPTSEADTTASDDATTTPSSSRKAPRGILRQSSRMSRKNLLAQGASQQALGDAKKRRSLFPSYSDKPSIKKDVNVNFSPMARVLSVKSHKEMEPDEKGGIWWQKSDYEEFRKTGRMITKAMLEGGSEIWLATNRSWQMPNQARSTTLKHATSLSERQAAKSKGTTSSKTNKDYENTRDKWWHKFGHSRRGLEHIASIDEGRQRQQNVKRAIRAVVEENKRQKAFLRCDADKLRMVSLQHTTWARDLAMAAGASDADAVHTNFNDESRKSREFYLLKFSRAQSAGSASTSTTTSNRAQPKMVPAFMRPATSLQVQPSRLDANTMSQIRYRQKNNKVAPTTQNRRASTRIAIKDASPTSSSNKSMAKKAAGFASGEEVANMSAVLTGMGPLPKNATMVGGA